MFSYTYQTKGTCSREIEVELDGKTIRPYLMPDDEYISRWKERVNNG